MSALEAAFVQFRRRITNLKTIFCINCMQTWNIPQDQRFTKIDNINVELFFGFFYIYFFSANFHDFFSEKRTSRNSYFRLSRVLFYPWHGAQLTRTTSFLFFSPFSSSERWFHELNTEWGNVKGSFLFYLIYIPSVSRHLKYSILREK